MQGGDIVTGRNAILATKNLLVIGRSVRKKLAISILRMDAMVCVQHAGRMQILAKKYRIRSVRKKLVISILRLDAMVCVEHAGTCQTSLSGIKHPSAYRHAVQRERKVSRAYEGAACHSCVRQLIVRAFLLEEQKAVEKVLAERANKK